MALQWYFMNSKWIQQLPRSKLVLLKLPKKTRYKTLCKKIKKFMHTILSETTPISFQRKNKNEALFSEETPLS
uniref:Uncharacterized protein n=1 Tax=Anguilla anguilla TaxID=7936 RepID=A0A0E9XF53_ANGAN